MPLNPSAVKDQVAFLSSLNLDKIVRVYEGTYNRATDPVLHNDGYFYRIEHDLPRPVFCELMSSTGGITYDRTSIAMSDSDYVYIFDGFVPDVGTVYYKVICSWIDNYDSSNPSIESIMYRDKPFSLDSRLNYQKIYNQDVLTFNSSSTQTVLHELGYIPNAKGFFEPFPGEVWPLNSGGVSNPFLIDPATQLEGYIEIYSDRISVNVLGGTNFPARVWYRIYYDD